MNFIDIYSLLQENQLTREEAAMAFGITVKDLTFRVTRWGHKLPLLLATLDKLRDHKMTRQEASEVLGVGPRQVNALLTTWRIKRPPKPYLIARTASKVKWEVHKRFALEYIASGNATNEGVAEVAAPANISARQMRRVVSQLLDKHFGMSFKDLKQLPPHKRRRLAQEIETAEGLELAKQKVLDDIAAGRRTLADEALERLIHRRIR